LENVVFENHKRYLERVNFYRSAGYDLEKERDFILDKSLPISGEILEIGTGKGHFALALAKRGHNFISIDISSQDQEIAMLNLRYYGLEKKAVFKTEDAEHLSFLNQSFDVIFCVNVFHHLKNPQMVLKEMIRLLRHSGKIILSDFNTKGLEIINACHTREGRTHDYFKNYLEEARDYLFKKGFKTAESQSGVQEIIIGRYI
jgi:ubiquinone/menaquinone biosynthesis C-methylase UbiE